MAQAPRALFRIPRRWLLKSVAVLASGIIAGAVVNAQGERQPERWWKGNLHTHSLWSDGDDYPEMIVDWYRRHGYHFLGLSDHNILSQGSRWVDPEKARGGTAAADKYRQRFGADWVEEDTIMGKRMIRLKPLNEFRHLFEEPGKFLLFQSEEITDSFQRKPIHVNATNIVEYIPPQRGNSVVEVMQNNVNAVLEQRERTGQPMFPHINHPNFGWAITAEELAQVQGERFFEVYNGHPTVHNTGDATHAGTDRMWDIILTLRLTELKLEPMFGLATDDSHHYHQNGPTMSNTGRGWVMVRSRQLTPESIIRALETGDFYASSGVTLKSLERNSREIRLEIQTEPGVTYMTQFIGTRKGFDPKSEPMKSEDGSPLPVTRRYSADIGAVLAEVKGPNAAYQLKGDEIYVRAKVISSKPQQNPSQEGGTESAWIQPVVLTP